MNLINRTVPVATQAFRAKRLYMVAGVAALVALIWFMLVTLQFFKLERS
jgi:hypothetical protein